MPIFDILVDAVQIVHSPGTVGRRREQVLTKGEIRLVIAQMLQDGGHDVRLLGDGINHAATHFSRRVVEDNR